MDATYHPEYFEIIDMPARVDAAMYFRAVCLPFEFALHPDAMVTTLCDGTIRTQCGPGFIETGMSGTISFETSTGRVSSLNGPLILEAADRMGIEVGYACAPECQHRAKP